MSNNTPQWLIELIEASGIDRGKFDGLEKLFNETNVVKADRFDNRLYAETHDVASELRDLADKRRETDFAETWADLIQDEFLGFWKADPKLRNEKEMRPDRVLNRAVMGKATGSREWAELRTYTELDQWLSTMASVQFGEKLNDFFNEQEELMEKQKEIEEAIDEVRGCFPMPPGDTPSDQPGQPGDTPTDQPGHGDQPGQGGGAPQPSLEGLIAALQKLNDATDGLNKELQKDDVAQGIRKAVKDTKDEVQDVEEALASYGTDPGELERMPAEKRIALAARIARNQKLRQLAEKLGRMVRLAAGEQARKVIHAQDEVFDVTLGAEIPRTLASEFSLLADEDTEILFYKKFAERELLNYEMRGTEKVARGGIIALVDSSGSMHGDRETWAKAVAIALLHIARKQKRDFLGAIFSAHGQMQEWMFKNGEASVENVLDFAESGFHGGTDFEYPLGRAVELLKTQFEDDGAKKGDIVIITDGEAPISPEWYEKFNAARKEMAFRLYGVHIGSYARTLEEMCDTVWHISDLATGEDVREIFGMV